MLKGLGLRDAPRAEILSEALQGPPIQPVGDQLAALSQVTIFCARQAALPCFRKQGQAGMISVSFDLVQEMGKSVFLVMIGISIAVSAAHGIAALKKNRKQYFRALMDDFQNATKAANRAVVSGGGRAVSTLHICIRARLLVDFLIS